MSKNTKPELSTTNNVDDIPTNSVINLDISEKASSATATINKPAIDPTITKPAIDLTKKGQLIINRRLHQQPSRQ